MSRDVSPAAKQRILNVNDSEAGRYATSRILVRAGFEVLEAANGMDALALTAQLPDLVLLDVNLPDMSGVEVCKRIKTNPNLASIPIVYLSATYVASNNLIEGLEGGADGYLVQPIDATVLVATIRSVLRLTAAEAALRTSDDRYRDLVDNSSDMICTHDRDGNLLWMNPAAERITGYSHKALLGMNLADLLTEGSRAGFPSYLAEIQAKGATRGVMRLRSATGEARWLEFNNTLRSEGVPVPVVRGMAQDVTERRKTQEELRRRTDELALHNQILRLVSDNITLPAVLDHMTRQIDALHPGMLTSILLLDEDGIHLRIGAAPGLPDSFNQAVDGLVIGDGVGSCGTAAYSGERVIVEDIQQHPYCVNSRDRARQANVQSCWSQPIKSSKNRVLGTFAIYHRQPTKPSKEKILLIEGYAGLAALAIEHKQASTEIIRQLDELRRWQVVMLDREDRNTELKREVNDLLLRLGEPIRYLSQAQSGSAAT